MSIADALSYTLANLFEVHLHKYIREWQQTPEGHDMYKDFEGFTVEGGREFEFPALNKTEAYEGFVVRHLTQHVRALGGEWKGYASGRGIFEALPPSRRTGSAPATRA